MPFTPSKGATTTSDELLEKLEKGPWGTVEYITMTRSGKGGSADLGAWHVKHEKENPTQVAADICAHLEEDAKEIGGIVRYRLTIRGTEKVGRKTEPKIVGIVNLTMGKDDGAEAGSSQVVKETALLVRELGGTVEKFVNASKTQIETIQGTLTHYAQMVPTLLAQVGQSNAVNEWAAQMFTREMDDKRERWQADREDRQATRDAQRTAEMVDVLKKALSMLVILKFGGPAAAKAAAEEFMGAQAQPTTAVKQDLETLLGSLSEVEKAHLRTVMTDDLFAIIEAAAQQSDDHAVTAVLEKLRQVLSEWPSDQLGEMFMRVGMTLGPDRMQILIRILNTIGIKLTPG